MRGSLIALLALLAGVSVLSAETGRNAWSRISPAGMTSPSVLLNALGLPSAREEQRDHGEGCEPRTDVGRRSEGLFIQRPSGIERLWSRREQKVGAGPGMDGQAEYAFDEASMRALFVQAAKDQAAREDSSGRPE